MTKRKFLKLKCNHVFCKSCIYKWKEQQNGHTCPMCRIPYIKHTIKFNFSQAESIGRDYLSIYIENNPHLAHNSEIISMIQDSQILYELGKEVIMHMSTLDEITTASISAELDRFLGAIS